MSTLSCLICVRDGERFIAEALQSLAPALVPGDEIIVLDDGSTDRTTERAAASGVPATIIPQSAQGIAGVRNAAIAAAGGETLYFLDHDDLCQPEGLHQMRRMLQSAPETDVVFGEWENFADLAHPPGRLAGPAPDRAVGAAQGHMFVSGLFRADTFRRYGVLSDEAGDYTDVEWLLRAMRDGARFAKCKAPVLRRRLHDRNYSWTKSVDGLFQVLATHRKAGG